MVAQDVESVTIKGKVTIHNKDNGKDINERVWYAMFANREAAQEAKNAFDRLSGDKGGGDGNVDLALEDQAIRLKKKYGFADKNTTKRTGRFEINTATTLCFLFLTGNEFKVSDIIEVVAGKTEYNIVINVQRLEGAEVLGKMAERPVIGGGTGDPDDGNEYFRIKLELPAKWAKDNARLIVQTYAVNCQTDDTLANCMPLVYEGAKYHELQDKRMNFDYFTYDSLKNAYQASTPLEEGEWIRIDTTLVFKKEDKNSSFRGPFSYALEDFHHVYLKDSWSGTCLRERPFKFLDFTPALQEIELTEEFREEAQSQFGQENRDLQLRFVLGKDILEDDSMNTVNLRKLVDELRSYGNKLVSPKIQGMASPDGGMKVNQALALRRAQKAASMIQPYLPSGVHVNSSSSVYTWMDVADALGKKGKIEEANQVREIAGRTEVPDRELRQLPFYETEVVPVLENMRAMRASYQYIRAKVMTADEAVDEYLTNRELYRTGKKHFSNGDYWNIFNNLTDSAEIDTLTMIAYRHITQDPEYATENIIAPYVCNRVALMNLKNGIPNARVLEPFIDLSKGQVNAKKAIDDMLTITVNRKEMLMNQAVTYYQEMKMDSAMYFINWLKKANVKDPSIENLERYMDLKRLHYITRRNYEQERAYEDAKKYVLSTSDENKAILYSEIPDWGMTDEAMKYVDALPDDLPKKWYLKALLWVDKAGKENRDDLEDMDEDTPSEGRVDFGDGFHQLTASEEEELQYGDNYERYIDYLKHKEAYMKEHDGVLPPIQEKPKVQKVKAPDEDIETDKIPFYLAYFNHAFEMEPKYKRMYFNEGHVPEDLRKTYKYKKNDIPAYRKLFRLLYEYEAREKAKKANKANPSTEDDGEDDNEQEMVNNNDEKTTDTATL